MRLLEKDATKRPASAKEVRVALEALGNGSPLPLGEGQGAGVSVIADPTYRTVSDGIKGWEDWVKAAVGPMRIRV